VENVKVCQNKRVTQMTLSAIEIFDFGQYFVQINYSNTSWDWKCNNFAT